MDKFGQCVDIGIFQFCKVSVFDNFFRERVVFGKLFQDIRIGAEPCFRLFDNGKF